VRQRTEVSKKKWDGGSHYYAIKKLWKKLEWGKGEMGKEVLGALFGSHDFFFFRSLKRKAGYKSDSIFNKKKQGKKGKRSERTGSS